MKNIFPSPQLQIPTPHFKEETLNSPELQEKLSASLKMGEESTCKMLMHYITHTHISFIWTLATCVISSFWRRCIKSENATAATFFLHKADLCPQCLCANPSP